MVDLTHSSQALADFPRLASKEIERMVSFEDVDERPVMTIIGKIPSLILDVFLDNF